MPDKKSRETKPIELTERDLDASEGGGFRRPSGLAPGAEGRERDGKGSDRTGSPVFDLPEDFAP